MGRLRTIVVEDERLPRLTLLQKLSDMGDRVEVVADCDSYEAARTSIGTLRPDLVIMDIQLGGRDSIQLLNELERRMKLPYIIFTTAYDDRDYLMNAIKLQAVDYLLKPVSRDELAAAVGKVWARVSDAQRTSEHDGGQRTVVALRTSKGRSWVDVDRIAYVKAARNYSVLVCFDHEEVVLDNLMTLAAMLDPERFVRVDRSTIVNRSLITQLNVKRQTCLLRSAEGIEIELELSKVAVEYLNNMRFREPS